LLTFHFPYPSYSFQSNFYDLGLNFLQISSRTMLNSKSLYMLKFKFNQFICFKIPLKWKIMFILKIWSGSYKFCEILWLRKIVDRSQSLLYNDANWHPCFNLWSLCVLFVLGTQLRNNIFYIYAYLFIYKVVLINLPQKVERTTDQWLCCYWITDLYWPMNKEIVLKTGR
jgi:hypothetical protein